MIHNYDVIVTATHTICKQGCFQMQSTYGLISFACIGLGHFLELNPIHLLNCQWKQSHACQLCMLKHIHGSVRYYYAYGFIIKLCICSTLTLPYSFRYCGMADIRKEQHIPVVNIWSNFLAFCLV